MKRLWDLPMATGWLLLAVVCWQLPETEAVNCQALGEWGNWEPWTECPDNPPIPLLNIRRRLRYCNPVPPNCTAAGEYNCNDGAYAQVVTCEATTTPATSTTSTTTTTRRPTTSSSTSTTTTTTTTPTTTTSTTTTSPSSTTTTSTTTTTTPSTTTSTSTTSTSTSTSITTSSTTTTMPATTTMVITTAPSTTADPPTTTLSTTTTTTTTSTTTAAPITTTLSISSDACAGTQWQPWLQWSTCSDDCGSCGTHQRFRACTKTSVECKCPGTAIGKEYCNILVCKYPRPSPCCSPFTPASQEGQFVCVSPMGG